MNEFERSCFLVFSTMIKIDMQIKDQTGYNFVLCVCVEEFIFYVF